MKQRAFLLALVLLLTALFPMTAFAMPSVTVQAAPSRAQAGETVTVSGTAAANELLGIKVTDADDNIVYYNAARAGSDGTYHDSFTVPDIRPQKLTVVAGNGSSVATASVEIFIQKYVTVTFNKNGGDTEASPASVTVKEGETVNTLPTPPKKEGYAFSGWYMEKECQNVWRGGDKVTADITVYARWAINAYSVKFFKDSKTQIGQTQTVQWGNAAKAEAAPSVNGCKFDGWKLSGDDDAVATSLDCVKENIVATAFYTAADAETTTKPAATPAASPSANTTPTAMPTASPTASTSPALSHTPAAAPTVSETAGIVPDSVQLDEQSGLLTVTIDISSLPEGAASVRLADGTVVQPDQNGKLKFSVSPAEYDAGSVRVIVLDEQGTPLGTLAVKSKDAQAVAANSGGGILAVLVWILGGLLLAGLAILAVMIMKKKHRS